MYMLKTAFPTIEPLKQSNPARKGETQCNVEMLEKQPFNNFKTVAAARS